MSPKEDQELTQKVKEDHDQEALVELIESCLLYTSDAADE